MASYEPVNVSLDCAFSSLKISPSGNRGISTSLGNAHLHQFSDPWSQTIIPSIRKDAHVIWGLSDDRFAVFGGLGSSDGLQVFEPASDYVTYECKLRFAGDISFASFLDGDTILALSSDTSRLSFWHLQNGSKTVQSLDRAYAMGHFQASFVNNLLMIWDKKNLDVWQISSEQAALVATRSFDYPVADVRATQSGTVVAADIFGRIHIFESQYTTWVCEVVLVHETWERSRKSFEESAGTGWSYAWPKLNVVWVAVAESVYTIAVSASRKTFEDDHFTIIGTVSNNRDLKQTTVDGRIFFCSEDAIVIQTAATIEITYRKVHKTLRYPRNQHNNRLACSPDLRHILAWDPTASGSLAAWKRTLDGPQQSVPGQRDYNIKGNEPGDRSNFWQTLCDMAQYGGYRTLHEKLVPMGKRSRW